MPERHVVDAREQRPEVGVVLRLRGRQADGAHRPAVERAEERDHVLAARVVAGELEAGLDRLGAGVADEDLRFGPFIGRDAGELGGGLRVDRQVEVAGAEVLQLGGLAPGSPRRRPGGCGRWS